MIRIPPWNYKEGRKIGVDLGPRAFCLVDNKGYVHVYTVLPFTGSEKICWDCKHPRELWVTPDYWADACA